MARLSKPRKELLTAMMKDAICDAAVFVLQEHGVNGMTMDRVAAEAKLAKGSLYNYFQNKNDLIRFMYARIIEPLSQSIEEITQTELPATEKLDRAIGVLYSHYVKHKQVIGMLVRDEEYRDIVTSSKQGSRPRALKHFSTIIEQGIREGTFRPLDPVQAGRMLFGCVNEMFEMQATEPECHAARQYIELMRDVFLTGISVGGHQAAEPIEAYTISLSDP
jgi:AcrR family transcriptional regulator